jgi:hypothetical protein
MLLKLQKLQLTLQILKLHSSSYSIKLNHKIDYNTNKQFPVSINQSLIKQSLNRKGGTTTATHHVGEIAANDTITSVKSTGGDLLGN